MKTSTLIVLGLGAWAGYRLHSAHKAGKSLSEAITKPTTPVEQLAPAPLTLTTTDQDNADQSGAMDTLARRRILLG